MGSPSEEGVYPLSGDAPPPIPESEVPEEDPGKCKGRSTSRKSARGPQFRRRPWLRFREFGSMVSLLSREMQPPSYQVGNSSVIPHLGSEFPKAKNPGRRKISDGAHRTGRRRF